MIGKGGWRAMTTAKKEPAPAAGRATVLDKAPGERGLTDAPWSDDPLLGANAATKILSYWAHVDGIPIPATLFLSALKMGKAVQAPKGMGPAALLRLWRDAGLLVPNGLLEPEVTGRMTHPDAILNRTTERGRR